MRTKQVFIFLIFIVLFSCQYSTETYKEGKLSYEFHCAPCHGINGEGLGTLYPNLLHLDFIKSNREHISCWIHKGIGPDSTNAKTTRFSDQVMPAIDRLSSIEICNVLNYLNARLWNSDPFTLNEIELNLIACKNSKNEMPQPKKVK